MHSIWTFVPMQYFTEFLKMHIKWSTFAKFSHLISLYIHPWMPLIWGPLPSSHSQPDIPWDSQTNSLLLYFGICIHVASALFGSYVFELEKFMYLQLHFYLVFVFGFLAPPGALGRVAVWDRSSPVPSVRPSGDSFECSELFYVAEQTSTKLSLTRPD